jgi:poly-gamma-glutamate synthesis protein (capsule biosynthesis protein)
VQSPSSALSFKQSGALEQPNDFRTNTPLAASSTLSAAAMVAEEVLLSPLEERASYSPYQNFYHDSERLKEADSSVVSLQFFGDIMLDRNVAKVMGASGTAYIFEHIAGEGNGLDPRIDLTIANNEGPYAPARVKTSKSIAFRFDPKYATELKNAGFDVVSLANNHTLDMGWKNVDFTHQTLAAAGVGHFGDQLRESKDFTYVTTTRGQTMAFVGFNNTDHVLDLKKVSAVIDDARMRASTTIVMMHWGEEYKRISNLNQRTFARFLVDEGVDVVIGAHPHVVQEAEIYKGKPIFYSLGNFVFDQYFSNDTQEGLSIGLILKQGNVHSVYAFPLYSVKSQVFLMDGQRRDSFYEWLNRNSRLGEKKFEGGKIDL